MHTSTELSDQSFDVTLDGVTGTPLDLFPGFDEHDRIGVIFSRPLGALGASLLYLAAVHAFYELCRKRSRDFWIYPDFFFFHVGWRHGQHGSLDVWPDHKEVLVQADGDRLLEAVNDRAITRLLVPGDLDVGRPKRREGLASYSSRMRGAFTYSVTGGAAAVTSRYVDAVLDPLALIEAMPLGYEASVVRRHLDEVSEDSRDQLRRQRRSLIVGGRPCEMYRRITPESALEQFAGGRSDGS